MTFLQIIFLLFVFLLVLFLVGILFLGGSRRQGDNAGQSDKGLSGKVTPKRPVRSGSEPLQPMPPQPTIPDAPPKPTVDLLEVGVAVDPPAAILNVPLASLRTRSKLYHYTALVTSVYDGDTLTVDVDLGLNMWVRNQVIRLWKINTPELRGAERASGLEARDFVRELVLNKYILLRTILDKRGQDQTGKYGRLLGEILLEDEDGEILNINELLLAKGLAVPFGEDGSAIVPAGSTAPMPSGAPMPDDPDAPRPAPQHGSMNCPYCGELRGVDLVNHVVLNCPNCMDGSYWYSEEEQSLRPL